MPPRQPLLDVVIVVLLALMLATGLPEWLPGVKAAERLIDPLADVTGLQQSNWQLFAPEPDHMNAWIEARITWSDGSTSSVTTPDWRERSLVRKFVEGRYPKIVDYVRRDDWKKLWPAYAEWVARTADRPAPGVRPREVTLVRHWMMIPPPAKFDAVLAKYGSFPPAREQYPHAYAYYTWRARR